MREILFRGKCLDYGEWVNGYYVELKYDGGKLGKCGFIYPCTEADYISVAVDSKTIGQYTGLTANGKKIFEGDIIKSEQDEMIGVIRFGEYQTTNSGNGECHLGFSIEWYGKYSDIIRRDLGWWINAGRKNIEIIGNIHDNPELLEEKK
jgi:uncharacterized phage protein (TIGR01671 family)